MNEREKLLAALDAGDKVTVLDLFDEFTEMKKASTLVYRLRSGGEDPLPSKFVEQREWLRQNWALRLEAADRIEALEKANA